jgi:chorismate mutase
VSGRFEELRAEITANDEAIVAAVNRRLELVADLWQLKAELGLETADPDRERRLREHLAATSNGRLSAEGVDRLVTVLLDLTKRELGS